MEKIAMYSDNIVELRQLRKELGDSFEIMPVAARHKFMELIKRSPQLRVIILDFEGIGFMQGVRLLDELQKSLSTKDIPVVIIYCEDENFDKLALEVFDIAGYFSKPLDMDDLKKALRDVIGEKRQGANRIKDIFLDEHNNDIKWLRAMTRIAEGREGNTDNHILRVQISVNIMAKLLHQESAYLVSKEDLTLITTASIMHDIGKMLVPQNILDKKGKLSVDEFNEIKKHTTGGRDIIKVITQELGDYPLFDFAAKIALNHHERWDGQGYPRGLSGDRIPLCARILAVADIYDVLLSKRVYREPLTNEQARQVMREGSGTVFDPDVIKVFFKAEKLIQSYLVKYSDFKGQGM